MILVKTTPVLEAEGLQEYLRRSGITPCTWVVNAPLAATSITRPVLAARDKAEAPEVAKGICGPTSPRTRPAEAGRSAIDQRTTRHPGYAASQRARKQIEEAFGWMKAVAGMRRTMLRGIDLLGDCTS